MEFCNAVIIAYPRKVELRSIKLPPITDESVVVETVCSSISAGSEGNLYTGRGVNQWGGWYPMVPGYEGVGRIVYVGKKIKEYEVGERVCIGATVGPYEGYCSAWGGQIEYGIQTGLDRIRFCVKIPENVSYEEAVLSNLAAVSKLGIKKVSLKKGETVLVIGQGIVGTMAVQNAKLLGAKVIVSDLYEKRLEKSRLFADEIVNARQENLKERIMELTNNHGVDIVIEATGIAENVPTVINYVRRGGRVHLQGFYPDTIAITRFYEWWKIGGITWSTGGTPEDQKEMLKLISEGKLKAKELITHRFPVEKAPEAYRLCEEKPSEVLKVILRWK